MTQERNPWRDKYRRALAQQEELETTLSAQQAILQRAILGLSTAAEGKDSGLDERLQAIRASAKHNDVSGFDRMLKSLPRVTEEAEQRQREQWQAISKCLLTVAEQIQKQSPSADLKPAVKHFKKQIPKNMPPLSATLKRLLQSLVDLQRQALNSEPKQSGNIFSRLFKDKNAHVATERHNEAEVTDAEWEDVDQYSEDQSIEGEIIKEDVERKTYRERNIPEALLADMSEEASPPEVPDRVAVILVELLDNVKTVPAAENKSKKARERIEQGLKWFELAPTLEDIRDFVLQAYLCADNDYRRYLEQLYGDLSDILEALGVSAAAELRIRQATDNFESQLNTGMHRIQEALSEHRDIDQLKSAVESNMQQLQSALVDYKEASAPTEVEAISLSAQLEALVSKVQQMEDNEQDIRNRLEAEKQRAVTDTLTGLPNREAYGERIHQEMQRWQRYQHPLSMAVVDIDFFKKINDTYGHQTGDKVLKIVANAVNKRLREVDFMARFGGEEFVLILPETDAEKALVMLNRIRETLANAPFRYQNQKIKVTVSIGIAEFGDGDDAETVFARADKALYDAKEGGRNQCRIG